MTAFPFGEVDDAVSGFVDPEGVFVYRRIEDDVQQLDDVVWLATGQAGQSVQEAELCVDDDVRFCGDRRHVLGGGHVGACPAANVYLYHVATVVHAANRGVPFVSGQPGWVQQGDGRRWEAVPLAGSAQYLARGDFSPHGGPVRDHHEAVGSRAVSFDPKRRQVGRDDQMFRVLDIGGGFSWSGIQGPVAGESEASCFLRDLL